MKKEKNDFKFDLGQRVFVLGQEGMCIVNGRGHFDFLSGGKLNMYQITGAHTAIVEEYSLLTRDGVCALIGECDK